MNHAVADQPPVGMRPTSLRGPGGQHTGPTVYVGWLCESAWPVARAFARFLRDELVSTELSYTAQQSHRVFRKANQLGVRYVALIGEREMEQMRVLVHDMKNGQEWKLSTLGAIELIVPERCR